MRKESTLLTVLAVEVAKYVVNDGALTGTDWILISCD